MIIKSILPISILILSSSLAHAADYTIDSKGMHASIQFKVQHLGYSWLKGRFNDFSGSFTYDKNNPNDSTLSVTINTASIDSNHADRDKHLRSDDFFDVSKFPEASFVSTQYISTGINTGTLSGDLTLHGITKPVSIAVTKVGEGKDPWGGYRAGFEGSTSFSRYDFGIDKNLGPKSEMVEVMLSVEGRKNK